MLKEIRNIRQIDGEDFRRWYSDSYFRLIVWFNEPSNEITAFQLGYDIENFERVLMWKDSDGYSHNAVDNGETSSGYSKSAILVQNGICDSILVGTRFFSESVAIDPAVSDFVYEKLRLYDPEKQHQLPPPPINTIYQPDKRNDVETNVILDETSPSPKPKSFKEFLKDAGIHIPFLKNQ